MEEKAHIGKLFDRIAGSYDRLNHILSLDIDRRWRRQAILSMPEVSTVLDVAIGTADLSLEMLSRKKARHVTGIDLSDQMMSIGKEKCQKAGYQVEFIHGNAQSMPFEDNCFDGVTCAYGCRNFQDLDAGLREMYRVLKNGGQVTILEFSYPKNKFVRWVYDLYFSHILPLVGRLVSKDPTAYTYLNKSVKSFCWGEAFIAHMRAAGFTDTHFKTQTFGISTLYIGIKQ